MKLAGGVVLFLFLFQSLSAAGSPPDSISTSQADSIYLAGVRQYSEAQYERAIATFAILPADSKQSSVSFYAGLSYAALNDLGNARVCLSAAVSRDSLNISFRYNLGLLLARQGDIDGAIVEYQRILALDSLFFPAYEQLGQLCELWNKKSVDYRDSIWSQALILRPTDYVALYYHGLAMFRENMPDSGFVCLQKAVEGDSLFYAGVYELATRNLARRNVDETFRWFRKAVELRPTYPKLLADVGTLYEKAGKRREALSFVLRALTLDSTNAAYAEQAGLLYYSFGSFDTAASFLAKAIMFEDDNWSYHLNLALAYSQMDSIRLAVRSYKDAITAFHLDQGANLYRRLAQFLSSKKRFQDAKEGFERALQIFPDDPEPLYGLGWMHYSTGDYRAATKEFERYLRTIASDTSKTDVRKSLEKTIEYLNSKKVQKK